MCDLLTAGKGFVHVWGGGETKVDFSTAGPFGCLSVYLSVCHEKNKIDYYFN